MNSLDIIEQLPLDLAARLEADSYFADIPVIVWEEGDAESELKRKQAAITKKAGKRGVAVIVLQIAADDDYPNLMAGPMTLLPAFQVIENLSLNRDANGTGKTARQVARRIRDVIKTTGFVGVVKDLKPDRPCIEPFEVDKELARVVRAYQVSFRCIEVPGEIDQVVQMPVGTVVGNTVVLSCATADAVIYYTLDGSFPWSGNDAAKVYAEPLQIPADGLEIRVAAYKTEMIASWCNQFTVEETTP